LPYPGGEPGKGILSCECVIGWMLYVVSGVMNQVENLSELTIDV